MGKDNVTEGEEVKDPQGNGTRGTGSWELRIIRARVMIDIRGKL